MHSLSRGQKRPQNCSVFPQRCMYSFFHQQMVRLTSAKAKGTAGLHLRLWKATTSTMCHLFGLHNSTLSENKVLPLCIENDCVFPIYDKNDASCPSKDRRAKAYTIDNQV